MPSTPWRKIETTLVTVAKGYGLELDRDHDSGDVIARECLIFHDTDTVDDLNLTELAKDLERELAS